ncbi:GTP cyclohydrolase II [Myxococcus sp. MISCRS1]|uniref:GTP cyclohydrolase II n=1 Tax=Myxococcus TaxID=32 RepID=UPI001CBCFBFA|nr:MULTISPECIES: GTP cyclohydrolase II [unclassified Myxococcus]MBZ4399280.1 GTP cyclohydrolase II [Myxococcus sp. AS-1-15]MBZ4411514.1 GTP cyclohydrolase II [Myxococcus sp. XM-1-1-1]MCY0999774.1 GTP cyclohydrolase II [Myxococcus sp. MISCRS1]BDT30462.1 GTP cyclohydrolase II [Myxococcus sp. MH1]
MADKKPVNSIRLTSHPDGDTPSVPIRWGEVDPLRRGPVVATLTEPGHRNVIGTHAGSYAVYRALAVAAGMLPQDHRADLKDTSPAAEIGPHPSWSNPDRIVSLDPWGAVAPQAFRPFYEQGVDFRPTIAVTRAHINLPELRDAVEAGRLVPDGDLLTANGDIKVVKAAVDPVWHLPGIARRFGLTESALRRGLFEQTGGMFPELITRPDLHVFLPPIGGLTLYAFGDIRSVANKDIPLAVRVHDECNGSDVFGSDICTCRPYLAHGIEECVRTSQAGGAGIIVYLRKEGRALGEVTKFLVYNARKRQEGGDSAATYFHRTECVAGVQDMRFQELMPDVLHWLGITRIHRFVSMSDMKHDAIVRSGIEILERVPIPEELIPADAKVEMEAKKAAGYFTKGPVADAAGLAQVKGRGLDV